MGESIKRELFVKKIEIKRERRKGRIFLNVSNMFCSKIILFILNKTEENMYMSKIDEYGRITIPKDVREKFKLTKGVKVKFRIIKGKIILGQVKKDYFIHLAGILGTKGKILTNFKFEKSNQNYF